MKPIIPAIVLLFLLWTTHAVGQEIPPKLTKKSIKDFAFTSGVTEVKLKLTNGHKWPFMVSVPENRTADTPLILALHWGVTHNRYDEFMQCLVFPSVDTSKYTIIAPLAESIPWWMPPKEQQVTRLLTLIRTYWQVKTIIVVGYSDGGTGAVHFAAHHPDLVDGAIAMAGYYRPATYKVPTYVIHDKKDELFSYQRSKSIMDENGTKSSNLVFITSTSLGHFQGCRYVELFREGMKWMEAQLAGG